MCYQRHFFSFIASFNPIIEMFAEILVLVSCWKKTYANHMLYRNISWNVFHFWDFWGLFAFIRQHSRDWQETCRHTEKKREGGEDSHATKASGRLKPWTLHLQEVRLLTNGAQGGTSWNVSGTIVSRHEHHLLSSHLSPLPTLRFDCTVHKLLCCCFFLLNFYSWSNQLKNKKSRMKF